MPKLITLLLLVAAAQGAQDFRKALTFHASFDKSTDADFALGDRQLYTAPSYKAQAEAKAGLGNPEVSLVAGQGRYGGALQFRKKNTMAIFYKGEKNIAYRSRDWNGTVSFWLSLDPDTDLEPGFTRRLIAVTKPPFSRGQWTHIVIVHWDLGSEAGGVARLYLNGKLQGSTEPIREPFTWDLSRAAIRLGVNYVGLFDDLTVFNRALTDKEAQELYRLEQGGASLHR